MEIRAIRDDEHPLAAALVYEATRGAPADAAGVKGFLDEARSLGTDLSRQVVAVTEDATVVACAMYFPAPDGSAIATRPFCRAEFARTELQLALMRALCAAAAADGTRMLQTFSDEHDVETHHVFVESGFEELALMLFMERGARDEDRNITLDTDIRWIPYAPEHEDAFAHAVDASYEGTLDCVRLGVAGRAALSLDTYRARGDVDPSLWLLAQIANETVGCLMLLSHPDENTYEVGYIAVLPKHRGKGLGRKVMERGLFEVASRSLDAKLTLAVDESNVPAVNMYRALAFVVTDRKRVHFSLLATV